MRPKSIKRCPNCSGIVPNFVMKELNLGIIYLVHMQNYLKNLHFLPPDTHTYGKFFQCTKRMIP